MSLALTDLELARRIAAMMPRSGAADAVRRFEELAAAGFESEIIRVKDWWLVKEPPNEINLRNRNTKGRKFV